jgi:hypothetical protein
MGAEQLHVSRMAKAARTGMVLMITIALASSKSSFVPSSYAISLIFYVVLTLDAK